MFEIEKVTVESSTHEPSVCLPDVGRCKPRP